MAIHGFSPNPSASQKTPASVEVGEPWETPKIKSGEDFCITAQFLPACHHVLRVWRFMMERRSSDCCDGMSWERQVGAVWPGSCTHHYSYWCTMQTLNMGIVLVATVLPGDYIGARNLLKDFGVAEGWKALNPALLCAPGHILEESHFNRDHIGQRETKGCP